MNTGQVESWSANPGELGALYPFVGWELVMFVVGFGLWAAYTVWQMKHEQAHYSREDAHLRKTSVAHAIRSEAE